MLWFEKDFETHFPDPLHWVWGDVAIARTEDGYPRAILIDTRTGVHAIIGCLSRDAVWHVWLDYRMTVQHEHEDGDKPMPNLIEFGIYP